MATAPTLSPQALAFIEDLGALITEGGLPRSVGRVLGLLLICEPHQQTAAQIQLQLALSSGSVSAATTFLQSISFIKRSARSGSRRHYYEVEENCWQYIVEARLQQMLRGIKLADRGLAIRPSDPRLLGMRHVYSEFERTLREFKP